MKKIFCILLLLRTVLCAQDPPPGYYDSAVGLTGDSLRVALNAIIRNHTVVSYANTESALYTLDEDPTNSGRVILLYAQRSEPKENFGTTDGWNREHVWPNSYGLDDSGPEYSDLFNIRAEDATVNSSRGNKYFDYPDTKSASYRMPAHSEADPSTATDSNSWLPPQNVKGDVARACFYMDVRYAGSNGEPDLVLTSYVTDISSATNYMGRLATLLQWHIDDPVDAAERARNDLIFAEYQHNRNPFIDHPEWVQAVFHPVLRREYDTNASGFWFYWDRIHAGARLETNIDLNHIEPAPPGSMIGWFLLPGTPGENEQGSFQQFDSPSQCDFDVCVQFYRLNLRP